MKEEPKGKEPKKSPLSSKTSIEQLLPINLEDKKSVRTTFKLSKAGIEALNAWSKYNNISFKEIVDSLCQKYLSEKLLAGITRMDELKQDLTIRKTYVISKGSLRTLNQASKKQKMPRDELLDKILIFFQLILKDTAEATQRRRKEALTLINDYASSAYDFEKKLTDIVGPDDPVLIRFGYVIVILNNLQSAIECNLKQNKPIDPDDMSQSS